MPRLILLAMLFLSTLSAANKPSLQPRTYEICSEAQKAIDAQSYEKAARLLDGYVERSRRHPYDAAYVQTVYGYLYIATEQYEAALAAFRRAYDAEALPASMAQNVLYNVAQLEMSLQHYEAAAQAIETWMQTAATVRSADYMMLAGARLQLKAYAAATEAVYQAIAHAEEPAPAHYELLFYLLYEQKLQDRAISTLKMMLSLFEPKKSYYVQLAGLLQERGGYADALAVLELAYLGGMLESESELLQLAHLYRYREMPYRAARLLMQGMQREQIGKRAKTLLLLAECLRESRAYAEALQAYEQAAQKSDDGEIYAIMAQLYTRLHDYDGVIDATEKGLAKQVKHPEDLYYLQGLALFEQKHYLLSKKQFDRAAKYKKYKKASRQWVRYLEEVSVVD